MALEREMATYRRNFESLRLELGKYVLIHGDDVIDTYTSFEDALKAGYARFQLEPFMVNQIEAEDAVHYVTRAVQPIVYDAV